MISKLYLIQRISILFVFVIGLIFFTGCGGSTEDDVTCTEATWYKDADGDGSGNMLESLVACEQPTGYVSNSNDKNDQDSSTIEEGTDDTGDTGDTGDTTDDNCVTSTADNDMAVLACKFYNDASLTVVVNDNTIKITSTSEPDHKSMYYATSNSLYQAYDNTANDPDFKKNPNTIGAMNYTFTIPRFPTSASNKKATGFGAMGVSLNSVVFYNQVAAPGDDILEELHTFDQYAGHPTNTGSYHYHIEPTWLTELKGSDTFLGFLLDGFPVYGPYENDVEITNDDLDDYHGHTGVTADFPAGIYHYHITTDFPWINGDGYYGTAGTVTQ
ncbi:MAG: YHYH protein [Flammeovirgaceae bacterium]|jgi:hypothetical protein|nr:YHYH protein [Flammeovirgaceae bacterium]